MKKYFIYSLTRPDTGVVFYVGATTCRKARYVTHCSSPKTPTTIELRKKGIKPIINTLEVVIARSSSAKEAYWINYFCNMGVCLDNVRLRYTPKQAESALPDDKKSKLKVSAKNKRGAVNLLYKSESSWV